MSQPIGGSGLNLPLPQSLYPTLLQNAPVDPYSNYVTLAPGNQLPVPAGPWFINPGLYCVLQYYDPVTLSWRIDRANASARGAPWRVVSDGTNYRIANLLGCACAAIVQAGGSGYVESTTTVTASAGGSTWLALVGGMCSVVTVANAGRGYAVAPILFIPPPAAPGVPATGYCTIASGTVSGVTLTNVGAGYDAAPAATILQNPTDTNIGTTTAYTAATVTLALVGSGSISAVLCTNPGAPQTTAPTLSVGGAGSGATVVAQLMTTLTGATIFGGGTGITAAAVMSTVGGRPSTTPQWTNPETDMSTFIPRPAQALLANSGGSLVSVSAIYDGGLFMGTPNVWVVEQSGSIAATGPSVAGIYGTAVDTVLFQPAP